MSKIYLLITAVSNIINGPILPQYAYRNCQSFFRFAEKHGERRIEKACHYIDMQTENFSIQLLKNMIDNNMDKAISVGANDIISITPHNDNVRGAESYSQIG